MRYLWIAAVGMLGCAPPPEVDLSDGLDPRIDILYPSNGGEGVSIDLLRRLNMVVVVAIQNLDFLPANADEDPVDREGQGHWHLEINGEYKIAATDLFVEYQSEPNEYAANQSLEIRAVLVSNTHNPLAIDGQLVDTVEVTVGEE